MYARKVNVKKLFLKKSIQDLREEASDKKGGLQRTLSAFNLTTLGIGILVGAGVFVIGGQAAEQFAGPAVIISFILAAIVSAFAALCYAEFAALIPIAGGPYSYAYATLGEFAAWIIGWCLSLEYMFAAATVSVGWSGYLSSLLNDFGLTLPATISGPVLAYDATTGWAKTGSFFNVPAALIMAGMGLLVAVGIKAANRFNNIMVAIKLTVIVLFIVCGIAFINTENWIPFIPENTGTFGNFGWSGILRGAGVVFFGYLGFDALSTLAQESRNPQRDIPIGMIGSLSIAAIIYILMTMVLTGAVSYKLLGGPAPFSDAIDAFGSSFIWLRYVAKFGILVGLTSVVMVCLMAQTRIFYTVSQDGLLPKAFGKVHKKFHTPFFTTIFLTIVGIIVCGIFPSTTLGLLVVIGTLLAFAIVCFGVLVLRYKQPSLHRPFKVPFFPWIPLIGMMVCILQMVVLPATIWLQLLIWIGIGLLIYFGYGVRHSVIRKTHRT
ncbi:MAG: amino acid permease [Verrucomicrobia bacterium]|nr:amino acid permease [Verrucomicrobiota bacterium]